MASNDLIPALDGTRDGMNELAFAARNAELGVTNLTIAEEAQRLMEEQSKLPDHLHTYKSYEEILAEVTAKTRFQTQEQAEFNEQIRQTAIDLGLVVPGADAATTSTGRLTDANYELEESYEGVTGEIDKATEALNRFKNATPGSPGPGGMFEAVLPSGETALATIDGVTDFTVSSTGSIMRREDAIDLEGRSKEEADFLKDAFPELIPEAALGMGGVVMKPLTALIGEAGPEAVVPLDRAGGMGNTENYININVTTGVGSDPVATGRAVVDAIKRYESTNGKVFAKA